MRLKGRFKCLITVVLIVVMLVTSFMASYGAAGIPGEDVFVVRTGGISVGTPSSASGSGKDDSGQREEGRGVGKSTSSELGDEDDEDDETAVKGSPSELTEQDTVSIEEVTALLVALPTVEEVSAFTPEIEAEEGDEEYEELYASAMQEYYSEIQQQVRAARRAYDALEEQDKEVIDPELVERLIALEAFFLADMLRAPRVGPTVITDDEEYIYDQARADAEFPLVIRGGNPTIILKDVEFDASRFQMPVIDIAMDDNDIPSQVTLVLEGKNKLTGGTDANRQGCAGIRVATDWIGVDEADPIESILIIEGDGELEVNGGNGLNGGAGIGSNGEDDCGEIIIKGGKVTAVGGSKTDIKGGDGAGIGTGGVQQLDGGLWEHVGTITILGGEVTANGYNDNRDGSAGGAGIGTGGRPTPLSISSMLITIKGGIVKAKGGADAAGIGAGGNCSSGSIIIEDGTVEANGDRGGAAIGGSYSGNVNDITINGGSIIANGSYGSAGIGGGFRSGVEGKIVITGTASVTAKGGWLNSGAARGRVGGAGIGTGVGFEIFAGANIRIDGKATVRAYSGGYGANAIGWGTPIEYCGAVDNLATTIYLGKDINLLAIVSDKSAEALPREPITSRDNPEADIPVETTIENPAELVYYTNSDPDWSNYPSVDTETDTNPAYQNPSQSIGNTYQWQYAINKLAITNVGNYTYKSDIPGNWAVLHRPTPPNVTVTFEWGTNQDTPPGVSTPSNLTVAPGETFTVQQLPDTEEYSFGGWFTDPECTIPFTANSTDVDITLYGKWTRDVTPDPEEKITVNYEIVSTDNPTDVTITNSETVSRDSAYTSIRPGTSSQGYTFDGWYTNRDCTAEYIDGTVLSASLRLFGRWTRNQEPLPEPGEGSLTVSKTVSGSGSSTTREFTFTVTLSDTSINGTYGQMTFADGVAVFTLRHNGKMTAAGLPEGLTYTVVESNNSGYQVTESGSSGRIEAGNTSAAVFNNYRPGGNSNGGNSGSGGSRPRPGQPSQPGPGGEIIEIPPEQVPEAEVPSAEIPPIGQPENLLPKTGESTGLLIWSILMLLSAVGLLVLLQMKKE